MTEHRQPGLVLDPIIFYDMATKIDKLELHQLYALPKITPAVEKRIRVLEKFDSISPDYCESVCKLNCKSYKRVQLNKGECDILIVQEHIALDGKFDRKVGQQEEKIQQIIASMCRAAGFSGLTFRVVSLLKCRVETADLTKNKPPPYTKMSKCAPYLYSEIKNLKPKVIISTSTACTKALGLTKSSNTGDRGRILQSEFGPVVVTQHPKILTYIRQNAVNASSGYWSADFYGVILRDFQKAAAIARGTLTYRSLDDSIAEVLKQNIRICRTLADVDKYTQEILSLPDNYLVSWDIETTGFSGWAPDAKVLCVQFGYRKPGDSDYTSVVIPLWHRENNAYNPDEAWAKVTPILLGKTKKIGWNIKFDRVYTAACTGVYAQNIVLDGLLAYHMLDSGINGCYSLKAGVGDFIPETFLAGYEDKLPKLTKKKPNDGDMEEEESDEAALSEEA